MLCHLYSVELKKQDFFIAEINGNDKMSKKHSKYITVRDYTDNTLLVLSGTDSGVSLLSFTTIIAMPVGIASTSISLVFLIINGIVKIFLKQWERKEKKKKKFLCWSRVN